MTDAEIIKALESEIRSTEYVDSDYCDGVDLTLIKNTLDLINRQQKEVEKLNVDLVGMRGACNYYKMNYDNAKAEIKRLQTEKDNLIKTFGECQKDVIKEFAERLKANITINNTNDGYLDYAVDYNCLMEDIDDLEKEMVGEV